MGREAQPPHSRLTPRLEADLHRINFYRFCQLLEKRNPGRPLMGSTSHPADDPVRFAPHPGMGFPASELKAVEYDQDDDSKPPLIRTTFMGMYGVDSPLPTAYLDDITQRREGHEALQSFLDKLNALDGQRGKYLTVSELKSQVFGMMTSFRQTVPVEEQFRQLKRLQADSPLRQQQMRQAEQRLRAQIYTLAQEKQSD